MIKEGLKVSIVTLIVNVVLSIIKLFAGIIGKSSAMLSDAVHSISDVISTIIVIIGLKISNKENDREHQYGHERLENVASIILSFLLFSTGIIIGIDGIKNIYNSTFTNPTLIALLSAFLSIIIKEWMYWYTIRVAKKYNSDSLKADAWHHRSDAFSSIGSLIGIGFSMMGFIFMDTLASIIIALLILKISIDIFIESINKMIDSSCDEETIKRIEKLVLKTKGVIEIETLKTRIFGNKIYIDIEVSAKKSISFEESHKIAHKVHDRVEKNIENVKHCMVHINPK